MNKNDVISIIISDYLTHDWVTQIAEMLWKDSSNKALSGIRRFLYDGKYFSDCFNVLALNADNIIIGRLFCLKNQENPKRWYHGDLFVSENYRRKGIASRMISAAIQKISDLGGEILHAYTAKTHIASLDLHKSLGFTEKSTVQFDHLIHGDEQIMLEYLIGSHYNVIPAGMYEAVFFMTFYMQNRKKLHGEHISYADWQKILSAEDSDEKHFLACKGAMPLACLRINGLKNDDKKAWISMLIVSDNAQNQGVGTFVVNFAEEYVKSLGFTKMGVQTTSDNCIAKKLYEKCGYIVAYMKENTYNDGISGENYVFEKDLK